MKKTVLCDMTPWALTTKIISGSQIIVTLMTEAIVHPKRRSFTRTIGRQMQKTAFLNVIVVY
jgi:hypothetical protein